MAEDKRGRDGSRRIKGEVVQHNGWKGVNAPRGRIAVEKRSDLYLFCCKHQLHHSHDMFYLFISSSQLFKVLLFRNCSIFWSSNLNRLAAMLKGKQVWLYVCPYINDCSVTQLVWNARSQFPIKVTGHQGWSWPELTKVIWGNMPWNCHKCATSDTDGELFDLMKL